MAFRLVQYWKAFSPMLETLLPIVTVARLRQQGLQWQRLHSWFGLRFCRGSYLRGVVPFGWHVLAGCRLLGAGQSACDLWLVLFGWQLLCGGGLRQ